MISISIGYFYADVNRRLRKPRVEFLRQRPLTNLKGISLKNRDRYQIRLQITVSAAIFHSIATRLRSYVYLQRFVLGGDVAWQTRYVSVPDSYTRIPSERQSSSRSGDSVHLAHAALFPSAIVREFPGGEERRFVRLSGGRKRTPRLSLSKREEHPREVTRG